MKNFESFLKSGEVKKVSKDFSLAASLNKDLRERAEFILSLELTEKSAKTIFEGLYEALREGSEAILALDGFKSYSHEATFSYLEKYGFDKSSLFIFDKFRYKRNSSKYYGQIVLIEEAKEILEFYEKNRHKINRILKDKDLI